MLQETDILKEQGLDYMFQQVVNPSQQNLKGK